MLKRGVENTLAEITESICAGAAVQDFAPAKKWQTVPRG